MKNTGIERFDQDFREILRRNFHFDEIRENKEDITLIWLDERIDDSNEFRQLSDKLRQLTDYVLLYTDSELCINYINKVIYEKIVLIISDKMAEMILSEIISIETINSIFIYSPEIHFNLKKYSKDITQLNDQILLIESIQTRIDQLLKQSLTFTLFNTKNQNSIRDVSHNPPALLWFHLLIDVLKKLPQTIEAKQQMIDLLKDYYQSNSSILNQIQEFQETYQSSNAIFWYTKDSFIYRFLNKALRIDDIYLLYLIRFYIIDLCQQIENEKNIFLSSSMTFYRGQMMTEKDFENLQVNVGSLISPNGFFSTSKDLNVGLVYAGRGNHQFKSILFQINIDQTKIINSLVGIADIEKISNFPSEKEVLFSIGTTFKIANIQYDNQFEVWRVQLILTHEGLEYVQEHINSIRKDLTETNPTRLFGKLLLDMGQYSKAERYYTSVLSSLPENHEDFASLYHGLGYINYLNKNYSKAIEYDTIGYQRRKNTLPRNHLDVARSALNLGCDHVRNGTHHIATELLQEALEIRMEKYSGQDHQNIALVLAAIGENCIHLEDYIKASDYLTKALEMFKHVLPSEHAKIASTLIKIGYLFEKQFDYNRALEYYHDGHRIAAKVMSGEHPCLDKYFQRIIDFYRRINRIDDAIQFSNEKLLSLKESFGEIHPIIAQIYLLIGDLTDDIELKLYNYSQSLNIQLKFDPKNEQAIINCQNKIGVIQCLLYILNKI